MRTEIRLLLADFKVAARIGHRQGLEGALDRLRSLPEVASNRPLPESFLFQAVLPLGQSLADSRLPPAALRPFVNDRLAGVRAVVAAALGGRFFNGEEIAPSDLLPAGRDPRPEVRIALAKSLAQWGARKPDDLLKLALPWIKDASPRLRQTALLALSERAKDPEFTLAYGENLLDSLESMQAETDPDVRAGLAEAFIALGEAGLEQQVLDHLACWAKKGTPDDWLISQVLSAAWAARRPVQAQSILDALETRTGATRYISNARRALERHTEGR